jgi:anti-sigma B factor antagonist
MPIDPSPEPTYSVRKEGATTVIRLAGPLITDQVYINELGEALEAELERAEPPDLLIDLEEVTRLSSSALGKFMRLWTQARELGGRVRLCSVRPHVRDAFVITRFDQKFDIYPDADEALRHG